MAEVAVAAAVVAPLDDPLGVVVHAQDDIYTSSLADFISPLLSSFVAFYREEQEFIGEGKARE